MRNILLAFTVLLTACAATGGSPNARRLSQYSPPPPPSAYGEWYIEPQSCTVRARAADFSLQTDGRPVNGTLQLSARFISPLVQPPHTEISEILAPIPVEGTRRGYNIILAYDAANAAHMFKPDTFLIVRYQPLTSADILESSFQTHGLMFALADLAKFCEQ